MKKIIVSIILYFFLNVNTFGHLQHYTGIKYLEYDLYRNNDLIGTHKYDFIKNGKELVRPLHNELRVIMWKYCGVIKNETLLSEGLSKIECIKSKLSDVDVRIDQYNCEDLALIFDLQSSLFSAKATIVSALERNESRGAHQRSDFPLLDPLSEFNCVVSLDDDNNLEISKVPLKKLNNEQKIIVANAKREEDIRNKLLE